jgi:RAMP superfamily
MTTVRKLNSNYNIRLTVLSPLHIGAGPDKMWLRGFDFVDSKGKIWILDKNKLFRALEEQHLTDDYIRATGSGKWFEVEKLLNGNIKDLNTVSIKSFEPETSALANDIRTLIRDGNDAPYIPGSSLKGAMISTIFHYIWDSVNPNGYNKHINKDLLGSFGESIMRFIRPADVYPDATATAIDNVSLFNLYRKGSSWESDFKDSFKISIEHFKTGTSAQFRLSVGDGLGEVIREAGNIVRRPLLPKYYNETIAAPDPARHLFKIINRCTNNHLNREIDFFEAHDQATDTDLITDQLRALQQQCNTSPDICILRMAGHTGFHSITGDWRFRNHQSTLNQPDPDNKVWSQTTRQREPARYKSRKIMANGDEILLGFVKLELI